MSLAALAMDLCFLRIDGLVSMPMPMPMPMLASCLARPLTRLDARPLCFLWTAKKICPLPNFVLCSVSSSLETTFTNGENDHG